MNERNESVDEDLAALVVFAPEFKETDQVVAERAFTVIVSKKF